MASYLRHGHSSGPTTRPRQHSGLLYTMHLHGHGCNHIPSRVPARLRPTRTTVGQPLYTVRPPSTGTAPVYTVRPPSTGTASVTGPSSAQADSDPKTSLSRPLALTWNWSTVLTLIRSHPPTSWMPMVTKSESDPIQRQENRCQFRKSYDAIPRHHDERLKPRGRHHDERLESRGRHHDERLEPRGRHMV